MSAFTIKCNNCDSTRVKLHVYTTGICFDCQDCETNSLARLGKEELPKYKDKMIRSILQKQDTGGYD